MTTKTVRWHDEQGLVHDLQVLRHTAVIELV